MDQLIAEFEKALAAHKSEIGKTDNLIGLGEILAKELRKQREATATLGTLLADFYAQARQDYSRPHMLSPSEAFDLAQSRKGTTQ